MDRTLLEKKSVAELREIASTLGLRGHQRRKKAELVDLIIETATQESEADASPEPGEPAQAAQVAESNGRAEGDQTGEEQGRGDRDRKRGKPRDQRGNGGQGGDDDVEVRRGVLDLLPEGYGFLRCTGYLAGSQDVYVSQSFVRRFDLRRGDLISGPIRRNRNSDKFPALARVDSVEGESFDPREAKGRRPAFADLTASFPDERLRLATGDAPVSMRLIDLVAPIGKGQRGLIVSPPKAGKTVMLKELAAAVERADRDVELLLVLVDERPEEITDLERASDGEVISSTFDRPAEDHTQVAELAVERAKRLVERGRDVVVLLDSLTRLTRAYNLVVSGSGRALPGGIDAAALGPAKRLFGAARNIEGGGSLTIVATASIETGAPMDDAIFEEFRGTGNMEVRLDRRMERRRLFPAVDVAASGTLREDLLVPPDELETIWELRRQLASKEPEDGLQLLLERLEATDSNAAFLAEIRRSGLA